jgi:hypothetical protein
MMKHDPILTLNRSTRRRALLGAALVAASAVWAAWPLERNPLALADASGQPREIPSAERLAFNTDAFNATLWTPPPPPPAPVIAQKTPPLPLKLQLIGITRDTPVGGGTPVLRAALYDPENDRMLIVAAGERVSVGGTDRYTVASLTADTIELADGDTVRTLSLKDERRPGT